MLHPQAGIGSAPKVAPLRGGYITLAEAADAFLAIPRTANPNTHRAYASAIDRVTALLGRGILAGVLLSRGEVQRWSLPTVAVRVVRQPPDGTAFDVRSAALRQGRGKLGCLMLVVTVLMLLVVGAIGATLPADRGTDSPNYIAFMVGLVLVMLVVLAGDEPDERHLRLPDDATPHGAIAAAPAAHGPEGVFRGGSRELVPQHSVRLAVDVRSCPPGEEAQVVSGRRMRGGAPHPSAEVL
ncbi:hypothetical protein ACBJ59_16480 [Nonomuraea sp. MTCD27]|uniref:hypothetical protein n=1 Tax=Nonomuraea sp. MTCD27 TaxID=1676747 RepID=UPI0035C04828